MEKDRNKLIIRILILIVVILAGFIIYSVLVKPAFAGYVVEKQIESYNQGIENAIFLIMEQAEQCQTVPLFYNNQTLSLIDTECLQQIPQQE